MSSVAAGCSHSLLVDYQGFVWSFGSNFDYESGFKGALFRDVPAIISDLPAIESVSCSSCTSLLLDCTGIVWGFGTNEKGQLGLGNKEKTLPTKIENLPRIQTVSAGYFHSLFLDANGEVWSCGENIDGELGVGDRKTRKIPVKIENLPKIVDIKAGGFHSVFLAEDGTAFTCGYHNAENIFLNPTKVTDIPKIKAINAGSHNVVYIDYSNEVWMSGPKGFGSGPPLAPTKKKKLGNIQNCSINEHGLFLYPDGIVTAVGQNKYGKLGLGDASREVRTPEPIKNLPPIQMASAGRDHSLLVDETGATWAFGYNSSGQLGIGSRAEIVHRDTPTKISGDILVNPSYINGTKTKSARST